MWVAVPIVFELLQQASQSQGMACSLPTPTFFLNYLYQAELAKDRSIAFPGCQNAHTPSAILGLPDPFHVFSWLVHLIIYYHVYMMHYS